MASPLAWLHNDVILASRTGYPLALMIGFNLYGNLQMRRESQGKRYPTWLIGWPVGLTVYTYPASVWTEILMQGITPRVFGNTKVLLMFTFWFFVIQYSDRAYQFCIRKNVFIFLTAWWLADATRYALLTLERCVTQTPTVGKGIWTAFFWCGIVLASRVMELSMRGMPLPALDKMVPNTLNFFKYPILWMWLTMVSYLMYMWLATDCDIFSKDGVSMVECGDKNTGVYAFCVYSASIVHIIRGFWMQYAEGKTTFGEVFCLTNKKKEPAASDLERPLLGDKRS